MQQLLFLKQLASQEQCENVSVHPAPAGQHSV